MLEKMNQMQAKMEANPELVKKLTQQEDPKEVQAVLKEAGLDFTEEEVDQLGALMAQQMKDMQGELSEEDLEVVAGGTAEMKVDLNKAAQNISKILVTSIDVGKALHSTLQRW
ncbi:Nif11-like leader peptide family RiPP precursor [Anoxynatronum buryatiense]|uniref:Nif11-like leader peptide domain-containing protein n=1 Tax=Anoxynatronum buryatiense TaxID=489973 RepID=A0AA45WWC0_9CLOT|nr:Nif11-like leader peptide family RiPP precursor [Anoxynatronum buryatiense]SMP57897.1 nif11-like leader peptide domain-containing protein [Anoxynatronum buryatiense]